MDIGMKGLLRKHERNFLVKHIKINMPNAVGPIIAADNPFENNYFNFWAKFRLIKCIQDINR